jgi:hypothetical protein
MSIDPQLPNIQSPSSVLKVLTHLDQPRIPARWPSILASDKPKHPIDTNLHRQYLGREDPDSSHLAPSDRPPSLTEAQSTSRLSKESWTKSIRAAGTERTIERHNSFFLFWQQRSLDPSNSHVERYADELVKNADEEPDEHEQDVARRKSAVGRRRRLSVQSESMLEQNRRQKVDGGLRQVLVGHNNESGAKCREKRWQAAPPNAQRGLRDNDVHPGSAHGREYLTGNDAKYGFEREVAELVAQRVLQTIIHSIIMGFLEEHVKRHRGEYYPNAGADVDGDTAEKSQHTANAVKVSDGLPQTGRDGSLMVQLDTRGLLAVVVLLVRPGSRDHDFRCFDHGQCHAHIV